MKNFHTEKKITVLEAKTKNNHIVSIIIGIFFGSLLLSILYLAEVSVNLKYAIGAALLVVITYFSCLLIKLEYKLQIKKSLRFNFIFNLL